MRAPAGFTLLELLVVMAIIALVIGLVPGFLFRDSPALQLDQAARAMADGLRRTRSTALVENQARLFGVDVEARQFRPDQNGPPIQLDHKIELRFQTARREQQSQAIGQIRFYPDGCSTGGRIGLVLAGQARRVEVDWLTGLVSVEDGGGPDAR
jgi:general secretion pathway protein H